MSEIADTETVLEIENLYAGYYKDLNIIQDICIKVRRNQITAILGANGVGKSTHSKPFSDFCVPMPERFYWREKVC